MKTRRAKRKFDDKFKAETAQLIIDGHRTVAQVCENLDLGDSLVRSWLARARTRQAGAEPGALSDKDREELERLRKENRVLRMEREILKRAATFFAKESA